MAIKALGSGKAAPFGKAGAGEQGLASRPDQSSALNSSKLNPACLMIERSVPGFRSRLEWTGTVTVRAGFPAKTMT
jgi:hypothetical protein